MTKPVGGETVLLQPGALQASEPRRGAEAGGMPADGFALMMAGILGGAAPAAPAAPTGPAPVAAPPRQAGVLPWDVLAAAAEETGRLAAAFQLPLAAVPPAMADGLSDAAVPIPSGLVPPEAASVLPEGTPEQALATASIPTPAAPSSVAAPAGTPAAPAGPPAFARAMLPPGGPVDAPLAFFATGAAVPPDGLPAMPATAPFTAAATLASAPAVAAQKADGAVPAAGPALPPASPAPPAAVEPPTMTALPAAGAPRSAVPALAEGDPAMATPLQPAAALPLQAAQIAAGAPILQRRPSLPVLTPPPTEAQPAGNAAAAAPREDAAPILPPAAMTAPVPPHEGKPRPHAPAGETLPAGDKTIPEQGVSLPLPAGEALPEPQPTLTPAVQAAGSAALPPAAPAPLAQAPLPQSRFAAEAAPQLVLRMAQAAKKDGVETISVDLRPPELGRVELQLTFRDGTVQVVMRAEQADTFETLRHERHNLMQQMEQAGLQLGGSGLDLQHGPLPHPKPQPDEAFAGARPDAAAAEEAEEPAVAAAAPRRVVSDSLIDIIT